MEKTSKGPIKNWYRIVSNIIMAAFMVAAFSWIWYQELNDLLYTSFLFKGNFLVIGVYAAFMILLVKIFGGFKINIYNILNAVVSQVTALLCTAALQFLFVFILIGRVALIPSILMSFLKMYAAQLVFCVVYTPIVMAIYHKVFPPYHMLLIHGAGNDGTIQIERQNHNYVIQDKISCEEDDEVIKAKIDAYDMVLIDDISESRRAEILRLCFEKNKKTLFVPTISNIIVNSAQHTHLLDSPLFECQNMPLTLFEQLTKRVGDILLSVCGIIVLSPLMILTALAIFLYDRGPVFYRQTRYTQGGKTFKILKFRSMIPDAEGDGRARLAAEHDSRITPVGRFIRACRIDEIPQLFNVLAGDMSFVGPRPERPEIADEYAKTSPEFVYRLKMKAGLTGFAQVYGKYNTNYIDKLKLDLIYIERYTILLDIQLLLLTLKVIFMKDSTEGLEEGKITATNKQ